MSELVKLGSSSVKAQISLHIMYVLYKYDNFFSTNRCYSFKENSQSITMECVDYKDLALRRVFFFDDSNESRKYEEIPFYIGGRTCYCSRVWYDETEHISSENDSKSFPDINNLKRLLERCYKGIFRLEKECAEWCFYGPIECTKYIKDVDSIRSIEADDFVDSLKSDIELLNGNLTSMQEKVKVIQNELDHIIDYIVNHYKHTSGKGGEIRDSKIKIQNSKLIDACNVAVKSKKLYVNRENGFVGFGLKTDEYVCNCLDNDDIIVVRGDGKYQVSKVAEKAFFGKEIIYVAVYHKNDNTIYNVVYRDGKSPKSYIKRFAITNVIRDKEYDMTKGTPDSKLLYFKANPNGEAEVISCKLKPKPKLRKLIFEVDFKDFAIKNRDAQGNILARTEIHRITQKEVDVKIQ